MEGFEILIPISAIFFTGMIVLVPVVGITARFALRPVLESMARLRESAQQNQALELLERRQALMEEQLHALETGVTRLADEAEFRRQLEGPARPF